MVLRRAGEPHWQVSASWAIDSVQGPKALMLLRGLKGCPLQCWCWCQSSNLCQVLVRHVPRHALLSPSPLNFIWEINMVPGLNLSLPHGKACAPALSALFLHPSSPHISFEICFLVNPFVIRHIYDLKSLYRIFLKQVWGCNMVYRNLESLYPNLSHWLRMYLLVCYVHLSSVTVLWSYLFYCVF